MLLRNYTGLRLPQMDNSVTEIKDIAESVPNYMALNNDPATTQADELAVIQKALAAYGGKATNYSILAQIPGIATAKAFAIPTYYYDKFMRDNGLYDLANGFLNNVDIRTGETFDFVNDPNVRAEKLQVLRNAMMLGTFDQDFQNQLRTKLANEYMGADGTPIKMRFRSSTNSEDLVHFPCSGCYNSHSGDPADFENVLDAIRLTYSTVWLFRTFEERAYYGVDQMSVGMGLLVHHSYNTTANGVAITTNPFDLTQSDALAYYVNMAYGDANHVVHLPPGVTTDQFLYFVGAVGKPIAYISRTNQPLPAGATTVLTDAQIGQVGAGLTLINDAFRKAYMKAVGVGVLYLSLWAAFQVYGLIPSARRVSGHGDRDRFDCNAGHQTGCRDPGCAIALTGGFATPLLLSTGQNREIQLFSYVALLGSASVALVAFKPWRRLLVLSYAGTLVLYIAWYAEYYRRDEFARHLCLRHHIFRHLCLGPLGVEGSRRGRFPAVSCRPHSFSSTPASIFSKPTP